MRKGLFLTWFVLALALVLTACGGGAANDGSGDSSAVVGNPTRGEKLYAQNPIGKAGAPGCITCHSLEPDKVLVGPSHVGLGARAGSYVEGMSAEEYLHESIVSPNAHIVEGFTPGVMYQNYGADLNAQEIADLVAYLMTLQ
ncbi:MAG: c-type cytochrome [Chloroflexi bacterium]|nr:c-type cytochrome [Chloroflexota bacterium]